MAARTTPAGVYRRSAVVMGTIVTIDVPDHAVPIDATHERDECVDRALGWFHEIERLCTRFSPESEIMQLVSRPGLPTRVSPVLFEAIRFAMAVAEESDGAFDPTIGVRMERRGFDREHHTGGVVATAIDAADEVTYRDVRLDEKDKTVTLLRPLVLDLGGVAKGMAIDLAARELESLVHFGIDAGGDVYVAGHNTSGEPWSIGIRHPESDDRLLASVRVSDRAVCTSGTYERRNTSNAEARHIIDPRTGTSPTHIVSATVVGPSAMLADALATTAFVLGPVDGRHLLDAHGVCGVLFTSTLERLLTEGCGSDGLVIS